jgi:hypothetical protein
LRLTDAKGLLLAGLSHTKERNSPDHALTGWAWSADSTALRTNSLQTGNFSGKMERSRSMRHNFYTSNARFRCFFHVFSKKITGKIIDTISVIEADNRAFR